MDADDFRILLGHERQVSTDEIAGRLYEPGRFSVSYAIEQNRETAYQKPNEDFAVVDTKRGIFIVCDGITRTVLENSYPNPSPAAEVSKLCGELLHQGIAQEVSVYPMSEAGEIFNRVFLAVNRAVASYNHKRFKCTDYVLNDRAGCVAVAAVVRDGLCAYAYCGDCALYLVRDEVPIRLTEVQTFKALDYINREMPGLSGTIEMRREMRNNPLHPFGFGALTGEDGLVSFLRSGSFSVESGDRIIITSDGVDPVFDSNRWAAGVVLEDLLRIASELEKECGLRSDDKVAIEVRFDEQ